MSDTPPPGYRLAWDPRTDIEIEEEGTPGGPPLAMTAAATQMVANTDPWFSRSQRRDRRGRWVGPGGGGVLPGGMGTGPEVDPAVMADVSTIETGLFAGTNVRCAPSRIDPLMRDLPNHPSTNLAHLDVTGRGNESMYTRHAREIPRSEMPQLPENVEALGEFRKRLDGTKARIEQVDPRELHMTQNQLDSVKVGKLYGYIKDGGWQEGSVLFCSKDGDILDGHHRWAAASAVVASGKPFKVTVMRVDTDIDSLLNIANSVSGEKVSMEAGFRAGAYKALSEPTEPPPDINEAWFWFDGKWWLVVTDTADGVPTTLDLLDAKDQQAK